MSAASCRAQSLAVRLSSDRLPDGELLLRSPTTARSDIARMLQIKRREIERQMARCARHFMPTIGLPLVHPRLAGVAESESQCWLGPRSGRSSRMSMDRPRSRGVSFETPPQRMSPRPWLWPLLSSLAVGVIVVQVQSKHPSLKRISKKRLAHQRSSHVDD